jgi:type I restriction enzyme S subunit
MKYYLTKYDTYKDSGVEWLWQLPKHWTISRIKEKGSVRARVGWKALKASEYVDNGFAFLSTPNIKNKEIDFNNVNYITYDRYVESPEIMLKEDDILLAKDGSTLGIVNIVTCLPRETTVNSSIGVLRFDKTVFNKYIFYQIESKYIQDKIQLKKSGMGVPHLFQQDINNFIIVIPPLLEQKAITNYLDTKTAQIDTKIDLLTKKATMYGNLKQSLINEAVTHGLDKTVVMKESGVEWIGEVPDNWDIFSMKQIFTYVVDNRGKTPPIENSGIPMLEIRHLRGSSKYPLSDYDKFVSQETYDSFFRNYLQVGDILFGTVGSIGQTAIVPKGFNYCIAQNIVGFRTQKNYCPDFFYYLLTSVSFLKCMSLANKQSIQESIKISNLIRNIIPVPPSSEQKAIADYLDTKTIHIDRIIETIKIQIEKLKELRKTLINDVVTGKIKVYKDEEK